MSKGHKHKQAPKASAAELEPSSSPGAAPASRAPENSQKIALGLLALLALVRVAYLWLSKDVASLNMLIPGLDEDIYWRAAKNLHELPEGAVNYELLSCSAPWHVYWLYGVQFFLDDIFSVRCLHAAIATARYMVLWAVLGWYFERRLAAAVVVGFIGLIPAGLVFDASLFKTVHDLNFVTAGFALALWAHRRGGGLLAASIALGLLLGLSLLNQLNTILFFLPVCGFLWLLPRAKGERLLAIAVDAGLVAAAFLGLKSLQRPWPENKWSLIPHSGFNLYMSLYDGASVSYKNFPGIDAYPYHHAFGSRLLASVKSGEPKDFLEADRFFRQELIASFGKDPLRVMGLYGQRLLANLNNHEYKGVHYIKHLEEKLPLLGLIPAHLGLLITLAPLGLLALWRREQKALFALTAGYAGVVLATGGLMFVFSRFRLPLYIPLGVLALAAWSGRDSLGQSWQASKTWQRAVALVSLAAAFGISYWPLDAKLTRSWMQRSATNERHAERLLAPAPSASAGAATIKDAAELFMRKEFSKAALVYEDLHRQQSLSRKSENLFYIMLQLWTGQTGFFEEEFAVFSPEQKTEILTKLPIGRYESQYLQKFSTSVK